MRVILTVAVSALLLSACVAQWPSHRTGPRFNSNPAIPNSTSTYQQPVAPDGRPHGVPR
jgi:PBP1b-binding outer membrane lipoprotein LpoB